MNAGKGQVSVEMMVSIIIVLVIAVVIILFVFVKNNEIQKFNTLNVERNACNKLAFVIEALQSDSANNSITIELPKDANVFNEFIQVGGFDCSFSGNALTAELHAGKVRIEKSQGVVSFEQVE